MMLSVIFREDIGIRLFSIYLLVIVEYRLRNKITLKMLSWRKVYAE